MTTSINDNNPFPPAKAPSQPVGIGLRHPYYKEIIESPPDIDWMEVHPENYFGGGAPRHFLSEIRKNHQISLHAVGLSLGSDQPVSEEHLKNFKELIDIYDPFLISDHASWSASGNAHLNDLLPLPYNQESLNTLCRNIERTQDYFGRTILVENPSTYISFVEDEMPEYVFMNTLAKKTGCGILLDINNIFVQAHNHGFDAYEYIDNIDASSVGEVHLAGHIEQEFEGSTILVDTHSKPVKSDVWDLYKHALKKLGPTPIPTLIEWDKDFPSFDVLLKEAEKAKSIMQDVTDNTGKHATSQRSYEALDAAE